MATWLEISKVVPHGGADWEFGECLWAPTHKDNSDRVLRWRFWENVNEVEKGDSVLHLRITDNVGYFVACSFAADDGYMTHERPTDPGKWAYSESFYRVDLNGYLAFNQPIPLRDFFREKEAELRSYLQDLDRNPQNVFLFYNSGTKRLQCLEGAYLSIVDAQLLQILKDFAKRGKSKREILPGKNDNDDVENTIETDTALRMIATRTGQSKFAENVKKNFRHNCCFPECPIKEKDFLIGAHITRWADKVETRGEITNGLCFCPQHDRAFERGYFSIDDNHKIIAGNKERIQCSLFEDLIKPYLGMPIKKCKQKPDIENLRSHRKRIGIEA